MGNTAADSSYPRNVGADPVLFMGRAGGVARKRHLPRHLESIRALDSARLRAIPLPDAAIAWPIALQQCRYVLFHCAQRQWQFAVAIFAVVFNGELRPRTRCWPPRSKNQRTWMSSASFLFDHIVCNREQHARRASAIFRVHDGMSSVAF